jgi:hypothetical protein
VDDLLQWLEDRAHFRRLRGGVRPLEITPPVKAAVASTPATKPAPSAKAVPPAKPAKVAQQAKTKKPVAKKTAAPKKKPVKSKAKPVKKPRK